MQSGEGFDGSFVKLLCHVKPLLFIHLSTCLFIFTVGGHQNVWKPLAYITSLSLQIEKMDPREAKKNCSHSHN